MLELEGISKSFPIRADRTVGAAHAPRRRPVLLDVRGSLPPGVTILTGASGAGKTTLLRVLAGIIRPDGGSLRYEGTEFQPRARWFRSCLGYLPQRVAVYPEMSVRVFLAHMAALKAMPVGLAGRLAEDIAGRLGLAACLDRPLGRISHGQAKLACLAQALLNDPNVLFLDEPFEGLDHSAGRSVAALLARPGRIVLLTAHAQPRWPLPLAQLWLLRGGILERG